MKSKKAKHVKNGSAHQNEPVKKNISQTPNIFSASKLSVGAASVVCISIYIAYHNDILPNIIPYTRQPSATSDSSSGVKTIGGWRLASESTQKKYGSSICTIERRSAEYLTHEEFEKEFRFKKPLIVSFQNGASGWTQPKKWSVQSLKREYGEWSIYSGNSLEIVRKGGNGDTESSFTQFVDKLIRSKDDLGEPFYVFDRMFYNDSSLPSTLKPPKYFEIQDGRDDSIFFLGASSSGVSFHKHADAWNGVIYGEKRWFLYPVNHTPPGGVYPGFSQIEWFDKVYPFLPESEKPQECVQKAGEILYLPEGTYHGTINLGDTVAIGIQRKEASIEEEKLVYEVNKMNRISILHDKKLSDEEKADINEQRLKIYEKLYEMLPDSSEVMLKLGVLYSDHDQVEKGLDIVTKAINRDKYFVLAYLNKANLLDKLKRTEEAEEFYLKAYNLNPNLWDIHAQYGSFLLHQGRPAEAVKYFKRGTELNPNQAGFWNMLIHAQNEVGDTEGAKETERLKQQKLTKQN